MFHKHLLLKSKLLEGGSHGLFLLYVSTQDKTVVRNSLPGSPWMDGLHRTCELPEIVRKIIFACAIFEVGPTFSLDSQGGHWLSG